MPILKLSRRYCILAACAALFLLACIYLNTLLGKEIAFLQRELLRKGLSGSLSLSRFSYYLNWLGLLTVIGAIVYGFKIAKQAVIDAHKHAEVLQEAKQRTVEIAALYDITQDVSAEHDLPALLQSIALRATTLLGGAGCAIFLYEADRDDFQIAVESGVGMPIGTRLSSHEGLGGRVAETLQPVIVNDYQNWPYRSKALMQLPISATVCVPMIRRGELIGVLGVHEVVGSSRMFTDADARLLFLFADNAAGAVYNARLMDALKNSEERFRIAAECASDVVYDWDMLDDHVAFFGTLFGRNWGGDAVLPKTREEYSKMVHPDDRAHVREALKNHLETNAPYSQEYRIIDSRGASFTISDRATAIRNPKGVPIRMIGVVSDITERKKAEKMKSDFVSFVTHQLRTPLSGIKWMLELASGDIEDPEEMRSFVQDARTSTERLIRLVNDLLDASRLERGTLQINCHAVDLADLTRSVADEISPLMQEKGQIVSVQTEEGLNPVWADTQMLRQVVLNLISNAMKYTPRGGEIKIALRREDNRLRWEVTDTGIGIPKSDLGKLFEKFYRAENAQVVETEGTGLGLYLVRLLVEQFGGKVWCTSEEGVGSTFAFTLPLSVQEA
jgi:two-component system phosphate regulon sensor histidine kinase PhoR